MEKYHIELIPLPDIFSNDWDNIYQKWILLKTTLTNNILKESQTSSSMVVKVIASETSASSSLSLSSSSTSPSSELETNNIIKTIKERGVSSINSSNVLVTKLGKYGKNSSQYSIFLQILFAVLNIGVTTAFILYIIRKLLNPIFALTNATSQIKSGNLNVVVKSKVNGDELSFLSESFNSMVTL